MGDLQDKIMNIPSDGLLAIAGLTLNEKLAYKTGHRDARHAASDIVSGAQGDGWISVDTPPENEGSYIVGYVEHDGEFLVSQSHYDSQYMYWTEMIYEMACDRPNYWMPLPPAPKDNSAKPDQEGG